MLTGDIDPLHHDRRCGLTDLLLNNLIEVDREELEQQRLAIPGANAGNTRKLRELLDGIMKTVAKRPVATAGGDVGRASNASAINARSEAVGSFS